MTRFAAGAGLLLWLATSTAPAHELSENRATLVLREDTHLTLTLYVAYPEMLARVLAPGKPLGPFLLEYSAMDAAAFARELIRAQSRLQGAPRVVSDDGRTLALERWQWPEPAAAQAALRERVMQQAVGAGSDAHGEPLEIRAEAVAARAIRSISVQFPPELQRVLVVAYRPTQAWVDAGARSPAIAF
jgi:hypothetical protein